MRKSTHTACFLLLSFFFFFSNKVTAQPVVARNLPLKQIFSRGGTYEYLMLKALNFDPTPSLTNINLNVETAKQKSQLNPLEQAFGGLALSAAELYAARYAPNYDAATMLNDLKNFAPLRQKVNGLLAILVAAAAKSNSYDAPTVALRNWVTDLFRNIKIRAAKGVLDEYEKWKMNPCGYKGEGYKTPPDCALKGMNFSQWFSTHKPPEDVIGKSGLQSVFSSNGDNLVMMSTVGLATATAVFASVVLGGSVGLPTGVISANIAVTTCLSAAFGGSTGGTAGVGAASAIGASGWAGVVAAPIAATILAVVVGTIEGFRVVEAEKLGPMLKMKLGAAMTDPIDIANAMNDQNIAGLFFLAFQEASDKAYKIPETKVNGEVRFYCQAGYVSKFRLSYTLKANSPFEMDKYVTNETEDLNVGREQSFVLPYNATNIKVRGFYSLGVWKDLFNVTLFKPTFICYTSYGTLFGPRYKTDCPEVGSMTSKPSELTITQGGGYIARVWITYELGGQTLTAIDNNGVGAGWRQVFTFPKGAKNVSIQLLSNTGLVWEPWKTILTKTWPNPPSECIKVYGTSLEPRWNNECN